jgi:hypothetical protein
MRRVIILVLGSVLLFGCSYGEVLEFMEGVPGGGDLSNEENPTDVRAVGSASDARSDDEQAKEQITEALDPQVGIDTKIGRATDAIELRPADPRYPMYRAWFYLIAGDHEAATEDFAMAKGLSEQAYGAGPTAERRYIEFYLDAANAVLLTYPEGSDTRDRMEFAYCLSLFKYREDFGSTLLGSAYLDFTANQDLCT